MTVKIKDLNMYKRHYHKDVEKKETTLIRTEYAEVIIKTENIESMYSFDNEYVIMLKNGHKIQVSKEDFENVKSCY